VSRHGAIAAASRFDLELPCRTMMPPPERQRAEHKLDGIQMSSLVHKYFFDTSMSNEIKRLNTI
jgi:hypothetical protein